MMDVETSGAARAVGLVVGLLATTVVQSSSVTTSMIRPASTVSLVAVRTTPDR